MLPVNITSALFLYLECEGNLMGNVTSGRGWGGDKSKEIRGPPHECGKGNYKSRGFCILEFNI